jgi:hypothetical protein
MCGGALRPLLYQFSSRLIQNVRVHDLEKKTMMNDDPDKPNKGTQNFSKNLLSNNPMLLGTLVGAT